MVILANIDYSTALLLQIAPCSYRTVTVIERKSVYPEDFKG